MTSFASPSVPSSKKGTALFYVLVFASTLFIGILIAVYVITKRSNPVLLDEHGKPVATAPLHDHVMEGGVIRV